MIFILFEMSLKFSAPLIRICFLSLLVCCHESNKEEHGVVSLKEHYNFLYKKGSRCWIFVDVVRYNCFYLLIVC